MSKLLDIISRLRQSKLFNDSVWALLGSAAGKGLSLFAGIVVARLLGSEVYGEYGTIRNTLLMIAIFSTLGLGYSATKYIAESKESGDDKRIRDTHRIALTTTYIFSTLMALSLVICAKQVAIWIEAPHLSGTLRLSAIAIIFNAVNTTQSGELAGFGAYKALAKNNTIAGIATFILSIVLTYRWKFDGAIIALILSLILNTLLNRATIKKCISTVNIGTKIERKYIREILNFSIPIALQESLYSITNWLGIFILIKLSGYAELGLYSAAMQWMSVILFIPGALRNVALSHFAAHNKNIQQKNNILKNLLLINFISTFTPFIFITAISGWITNLYGSSFNGLQPVLIVSIISAIVCSLTNVLTQEFMSRGKNWFLFLSRFARDIGALIVAYISVHYTSHGALVMISSYCILQVVYLILLLGTYIKTIKHGTISQ